MHEAHTIAVTGQHGIVFQNLFEKFCGWDSGFIGPFDQILTFTCQNIGQTFTILVVPNYCHVKD
jgi:hypothetical protein